MNNFTLKQIYTSPCVFKVRTPVSYYSKYKMFYISIHYS